MKQKIWWIPGETDGVVCWFTITVCRGRGGRGGGGVDGCQLQSQKQLRNKKKRQPRKHTHTTHSQACAETWGRTANSQSSRSHPVVSLTEDVPHAPYVVPGKRATETTKCI